jgi:hypothetical protein
MNDVKERNLPPGRLFAFHAMMVEADGIEPMRLIRDPRLVRPAVTAGEARNHHWKRIRRRRRPGLRYPTSIFV